MLTQKKGSVLKCMQRYNHYFNQQNIYLIKFHKKHDEIFGSLKINY